MDKSWDIWVEGFIEAPGPGGRAFLWGSVTANTFNEACIKLALTDNKFSEFFKEEHMTWWACRLFDNEIDARVFNG